MYNIIIDTVSFKRAKRAFFELLLTCVRLVKRLAISDLLMDQTIYHERESSNKNKA